MQGFFGSDFFDQRLFEVMDGYFMNWMYVFICVQYKYVTIKYLNVMSVCILVYLLIQSDMKILFHFGL